MVKLLITNNSLGTPIINTFCQKLIILTPIIIIIIIISLSPDNRVDEAQGMSDVLTDNCR